MEKHDPRIPPLSIVLGFGPALAIPVLAAVAWLAGDPFLVAAAVALGRVWAAAILIFLAGVTRGLSFFTADGPRWSQIATTMLRFLLGLAGLLLPLGWAFVALMLGYASVALTDLRDARTGAAPAHFARLRVPQMALALVGLLALLVRVG